MLTRMEESVEAFDEPVKDNDDERLYSEFVEQHDEVNVEQMALVPFDVTDEEEREENVDMGTGGEEDEDRPIVVHNINNPTMEEGNIFPSMLDCRNALATYCITNKRCYIVEKSDPTRLRVHCPNRRCKWRMHASVMRNSTVIQVKVNPLPHTCPHVNGAHKAAKSRWCAQAMLGWVTKDPCIGPTKLVEKIYEVYNIEVPYMRAFYGKEMALDKIYGPWKDSFRLLYTWKAEVERACPDSVVEIDKETVKYNLRGKVKEKECFRRVFVSYKACWSGFLNGCRPYLAVDATALNGRFRGQLAAACAIDGHNWLFPVAYGVLETESEESWTWFLQNLRQVIGFPDGLVIHTDACKGLEIAVEKVFPQVEHRECMRHLAGNVNRAKHRGKLVDDNLWQSSLTYSLKKHEYHLNQLYRNPKLKKFLQDNHKKVWARSKFNELCKVDYVNNNLAECFNSWIRDTKGLHLVDLLDAIRRMIMAKFSLRQKIAAAKFAGHQIIPAVMKKLHDKTDGLRMTLVRRNNFEAEVTAMDKEKREWRYPVNLQRKTCSCRQWKITGLPCIHTLYFITSLRGLACEIDQYVHEYYSVARFNATYVDNVPSIEGKHQWTTVDPGFVLHAPVQGRAPGRPRKVRIRSSAEGRKGLGPRKRICKRCGGLGHIARTCKNVVDPAFGEDEHWGAENAVDPIFNEDEHWGAENAREADAEPSDVAPESPLVEPSEIVVESPLAEPSDVDVVPLLPDPSDVVVVPLSEASNATKARYYSFTYFFLSYVYQ